MNVIEQATQRLEQLARAGVSVPWSLAGQARRPSGEEARTTTEPTPVAAMRRLHKGSTLPSHQAPGAQDEGPRVSLDLELLERSGHLVPAQTRTALAEEFRHIKRPILRNAQSPKAAGDRLALVMVTSALPREGKTFCAINLAISIAAEVNASVLLVDADVVRPELAKRLGIEPEKGLLDLLADPQLDPAQVILRTNVPKLSILPAGTRSSMSTELLASEAMDALLDSFAGAHRDRIVIFDAPPLLVTNEAQVLASRVGQVVLVVEASSTPRRVVEQAFAALDPCPIVMSVLNKAHEPLISGGYGDYYG